jgi:MYXO-CTERM domain-containing protein
MPAGVEPHDEGGGGPGLRALLPLVLAGLVVLIALRRRR